MASEIAIKFHDVDENVQVLENSNWTLEGERGIVTPIENSWLWEIEWDLLLLWDWRMNELLPYDFSESFLNFGVLFSGDEFITDSKDQSGSESWTSFPIDSLKIKGI